MTTEEKAKAYDEALIKGSRLWECGEITRENYEYIFPEPKESYDERIRKAIRYAIGQSTHSDSTLINGVSSEEALAWLENQSDKDKIIKDMNNKDDEKLRKTTISFLKDFADRGYENAVECIDWLERQLEKKSDGIQSIEERAYQVFPDDGDENTPLYRQAFIDGAVDYIDGGCTKSAWNEEDTIKLKSTIAFLRNPNVIENNKELRDKTIDWLKSFKEKVQPQPKQELSKEDEIAIDDAIWCCKKAASIAEDENDMGNAWYAEHWLKTLKYKTHSLPQQEWGEEVEAAIRLLKGIAEEQEKDYCPYNANNLRKAAEYLETCRPQSTWKPSNEQLEALEHSLGDYNITIFEDRHEILTSLYQDLKELKRK